MSGGSSLRGCLAPLLWIGGFATTPDFEIEACLGLASGVPDGRDDFAGDNPVTGFPVKDTVVSVERHVSIAMVDDHQ